MRKLSVVKSFGLVIVFLGLTACGGGGGSGDNNATTTTSSKSISGGGVKGPLANALVTVYAFDPVQLLDFKGAVVATASTNASAAIVGLALPFPVTPPYILEFTSDTGTTDITTGALPVITTMRTVISQSLLDSGQQIYATPLTTMAVDIAIANALDTNGTAGIQADEFEAALTVAAAQVVSTLGFGLDSSVDIFDTPPLVDSTTGSAAAQANVAAYRAAVEAVTAIAYQINQQTAGASTDSVLAELSADLADGGGIDGSAGTAININTLQVLDQDPASLPIPNSPTNQTVGDVQAILVSETATTGTTTSTTELLPAGSIKTIPAPAQSNPDIDSDGVLNANDAFPNDPTADTDTDGDGAPDVAYTDAGRGTVDAVRSDTDDDNDGWTDGLDDYPLDNARFLDPAADRDADTVANGGDNCPLISNGSQTDTDGNGQGDACSNDSDGDGVDDAADNCPLISNPGQEDLDGDEVPGTSGGDACDDNIDGDAAVNADDAFPLNAGETVDTDSDGVGDNGDADDDNDGVADGSDTGVAPAGAPFVGITCSLLRDCDGDGVLDGSDFDPVDANVKLNFAPVANNDAETVDEDAATFAIAVTANDTDNDGNPNDTVSLDSIGSNDAALGSVAINGNDIDYTPVADASGSDTFSYTVTDGTVTSTGSVTVTVNAVNDAPLATDDAAATSEDIPVTTGNVLVNDSDAENDSLSVVAGNPTATNGTVVNNGDGTFTYTPNADINGADSFTYTVIDGNGGSDVGTVNVTIASINDAPDGVDDSLTTDEDTAGTTVDVLANDTDTESDSLSVSAFDATSVGGGSVADSGNGTYTYTPLADFNGADSFTYTVSDGFASDVATVTITVNPVNDDPVANADADSTNEDTLLTTLNVLTNDTDGGDGGALSVTAFDATSTSGGSVTNNGDGSFDYTPAANFNGDDTFTYTVSDGSSTDVGTVTITVNPVNDDPVANADADSTDEDTPFTTLDVLSNDTDGGDGPGALSVTAFDAVSATGGSVTDNGNGTFNYSPAANFNGDDTFTYTVSDTVSSSVASVTITVNPINDAPVGNADAANAAVLTATVVDVLANDTDTDGDTLTITAVTQGSLGSTVAISGGGSTVTFTDVTNSGGSETFSYEVFDGTTTVGGIGVTMTVSVNAPPVANADSATTDEDTGVTTTNLLANDTDGGDGNALSITAFDAASTNGGTVSDNGNGTFDYTPAADFSGDDTFSYTISDTFSTAVGTVTITVNPVNDDPVANADADSTDEDTAFTTLNVLINDNDGGDGPGALSVTAVDATSANGGSVSDNGNGTFNYSPAANFNGDDTFTYTVSDTVGSSAATVTITVNSINDDPVANDDPESVAVNAMVITGNVLANDTDVENDSLTIAGGDPSDAVNGIVINNGDGTFDYTPNLDYVGPDSFTYTVNDGNGGSDIGTVNITVTPLGVAATVANLLDETQGGGVGAVESWNDILPQFEYWRDTYDATAGTLTFIDEAYDYDTEMFVDVSGFDSYWLTSTGAWELPSSVDVITPIDGDGGMVVAVRNAGGSEDVANFLIRAFTQDIDGDLISDYVDANWAAQMLNPAATFAAGAQLVTSYSFESLTDSYSFELEDWCELEEPARYAALGNSCNGVFINTTDSYATTLAELQVSTAWTDTETTDDSGLDTVSMSYDDSTNSELLAELVVAGNVVNYYVRDYDLTGAAYIVKLAQTSSWSHDDSVVSGVFMIRFTVPAALQSQFPDLGEEGGLTPFFTEFGGFVRGGVVEAAGSISADDNIFNGIALDQVLANFDAPAAPDVTELIGTWVSNATSFNNGDPTVFHYFSSFHYEVSGTCDSDGSIGLEYGTMTVNLADGSFTTSTSVNGRGLCSLANVAGAGTTLTVVGDTLTLDVSGQVTTFSRLKGDLSPLVGSWVGGDITMGGDSAHFLLTFFDDGTYMFSEDCSVDGIGTEYGSYTWDEGGTSQMTNPPQVYDANGGDPGCGLSENTSGTWEFVVTNDTLTITIPGEGSEVLSRHSPTFVPITPPIAFVDPGTATLYNVELDDDTREWVMQAIQFNGAGGVTVDVGGPNEEAETYEVIGGILKITGSLDLVDYIMIMSADAASGADRVCWTDPYADLVNCSQPGSAFLFADQSAADAFLAARIAGATFTGSPVNASTVFAASGLFMFELDSYYDGEIDEEVNELLFFEITASGVNATDDEYLLENGSWVLSTDTFDIALTSTGWQAAVDWRLDTALIADPAVTLSNVEAGDTLTSLTASFSEMAIDGDSILDYVDAELAVGLVNGSFTAGAKVYETTLTFNNDYYYINHWGGDCDDGLGGNYNGNCNVAQQRTLNRSTGELTGFTVATDASFVGDNTATIELGWNPNSMSLVAVFVTGGVLEFWEVDWSVSSIATQSGSSGTWTSEVVGTETLIKYVVPVVFQNSYQVQGGGDTPAVFLSQQNGYVRFGELEDEAGQMETVYFFNGAAFQDINNNIPGNPSNPTLP